MDLGTLQASWQETSDALRHYSGLVNRHYSASCRAANVRYINPHAMRRTCGSLLAALYLHPRVAMRILRHSKIAITMEIDTEVPDEATRDALRKLGAQLDC